MKQAGLERAADEVIWQYALEYGFAIVSKDEDFHQLAFLRGAPPKVLWVRTGNASTTQIEAVLRSNAKAIVEFDGDPQGAFLIVESPA